MADRKSVVTQPEYAGPPDPRMTEWYRDASAFNYAQDRKQYGDMHESPWARRSFPGYEPRRDPDPALLAKARAMVEALRRPVRPVEE